MRPKPRDALARNLRPVATAVSEHDAKRCFVALPEGWGGKYPAIVRLWENAWTEFVPPPDLCFTPDGFPDGFATLSEHASVIGVAAVDVPVASLEDVVASKRAAGRPKDIVALPPLEARLRRP